MVPIVHMKNKPFLSSFLSTLHFLHMYTCIVVILSLLPYMLLQYSPPHNRMYFLCSPLHTLALTNVEMVWRISWL